MTHLVHERSPLNRPVLRNRMKIHVAGIALLALGVLSGQALRAQDEAKKDAAPKHFYLNSGSIELGGHMVSDSGSSAMWATMVNRQSGPRILGETLHSHSTDPHKTPFFDDLSLNSFGYGGDPEANTSLNMYKGKIYKFKADFRRNRSYFNYNLFGNPLIPQTAVPYVPVLDSPHLMNHVRRTLGTDLTLLPLSRVSFRAGYWRTYSEGPGFSSNVSKSNSNPLLDEAWRYSDDVWTAGFDFKPFRKTVLNYDQLITHFKRDTTYKLDPGQLAFQLANGTPASQGLNIFTTADNTCLLPGTENTIKDKCNGTLAYSRNEPVRSLFPTEQFRFVTTAIPNLSINGRMSYSGGSSEVDNYSEYYSGWSDSSINTTGRNILRYSGGGPNNHFASLRRVNVSGALGMTATLGSKVELSDIVDYRSFRNPVQSRPLTYTQFGTDLAHTSNFYDPGLCPPPYTASTCPLHTTKTAADISNAVRNTYLGQTITANTAIASYSPINRLKVSLGYRWRDRYIAHMQQTTTTSTFTPPFANRGACAKVDLNADGTCTVTPVSTPAWQRDEIHEQWGLFGITTQPTANLNIKLNVEAMAADKSFTQISPRQLQHYILRTIYRANSTVSFAGAINWLEDRDNVEYVHHLAHARDFSFGTTIDPGNKWSVEMNYAYDSDFSRTDVCYYSTSPLPGAGTCPFPDKDAQLQPYLGTGRYDAPSHFGSIYLAMTPTKKLQFHTGYMTSRSTGSSEILNERQVQGSLASQYLMPSSDISYQLHPGWYWKAAWNYYGYGEDGWSGPVPARDFHGNMFTLSVKHDFATREGK
jgi:hypothetical protein